MEEDGRRVRVREKSEHVTFLALKMEEVTTSQGMRQPVEARKSKETDSPAEPLEGMQPCLPLDLRPIRLTSRTGR